MTSLTPQEFEDAVSDALDEIPPALTQMMSNVVILVEDDPPPGEPNLLGLYEGVPLTERDSGWAGFLPDSITIFRNPLQNMCGSRDELIEQIKVTVVHEIAHHFGIDDARLDELGWG